MASRSRGAKAALGVAGVVGPGGIPEVIYASHDVEFLRGNQHPSGGWVHGPAQLELFKAAEERLNKLGMQMGLSVNQVSRVRLDRIKGGKLVYIIPTHVDDPNGVQVNRRNSRVWINIITLLGPARLTVRTGYRERFSLDLAGPDSPVGPALVMNLAKRLERRPAGDGRGLADQGVHRQSRGFSALLAFWGPSRPPGHPFSVRPQSQGTSTASRKSAGGWIGQGGEAVGGGHTGGPPS